VRSENQMTAKSAANKANDISQRKCRTASQECGENITACFARPARLSYIAVSLN
jgi:hypothetical protein